MPLCIETAVLGSLSMQIQKACSTNQSTRRSTTMKRSILTALAVLFSWAAAGVGYADTINGKIKDIDTEGNAITLLSEPGETAAAAEYKLVWEANLPDSERLHTAHVGEFLSVDAEKNPVTQNWKVTSVKGPLAEVVNAISSEERMISGQIRNLDISGNALTLTTSDADVSGKASEYRVVWDDSNTDVRKKISNAKIGDSLSLMADQNKITRNWKANSIVGPVEGLVQADVKTVTGEIKSVNFSRNSLVLRTIETSGKIVDRTIVWDKDFKESAKIEGMHIGDRLSVRADQNMLTRNWKVKALGT